MKYYKVIQNNTFIGVASSNNFVRYQKKCRIFTSTDEFQVEFIECNNKLYRDVWMQPSLFDIEQNRSKFEFASVIEIDKETYDELYHAIEINISIPVEEPAPIISQ